MGTRVAAVLAAPLAPQFGLLVAHLVYHPPRQRRQRAPRRSGWTHETQTWFEPGPVVAVNGSWR
jgi:hypothetical protein